jgi:replication fork protection complex subunit Tof1/Swi1
MFKDNKLRLLMTLAGFSRLGEAHDPDATWIVPSSLTSAQLQEAIDLIRKYEFDPPTYEDGKQPEDLLRSKAAAAHRSTRRVDFDDDDDGIDNGSDEDHGEYAADKPTARKADGERKVLKRRRRVATPVELDDEEMDRRAEARRKKAIEKAAKERSTMFVHDSDDEDDAEKDAAFFAREEALRKEMTNAFNKALVLGSTEPAVTKKRKAEESASKNKRRKTPPKRKAQPFADSDDSADEDMEDAKSTSSRALSAEAGDAVDYESEDETTDTPLSSQHAPLHISDDDTSRNAMTPRGQKSLEVTMVDDDDGNEDDDVHVARRPVARRAFIIDSDSE